MDVAVKDLLGESQGALANDFPYYEEVVEELAVRRGDRRAVLFQDRGCCCESPAMDGGAGSMDGANEAPGAKGRLSHVTDRGAQESSNQADEDKRGSKGVVTSTVNTA